MLKRKSIAELVKLAKKEKATPEYRFAAAYLPVVKVLRDTKDWTWTEIQEWLAKRGEIVSKQSLYHAYKTMTNGKQKKRGR